MITKPRFVTIDSALFTNGQAAIYDEATNSFKASDGSAVFRVLGNWATATDYVVNDVVLNDGNSYVCILAHTSDATNEPGVGVDTDTYWQVLASKGADGAPGAQGPAGNDGAPGAKGDTGATGAPGQGVPTGGTAGQVLAKNSGTDYDTEWVDPPEGGGSGSGSGLELGETSETAYRGDRGKTAYDHSQLTSGNPHNVSLTDLSLTATATELNYVDGVTSAIQTQLNAKAADSDVVKLTGAQTVAGVKTFSSSPVVPAPTTDMQAATKKYVDDNAGTGGGGAVTAMNEQTGTTYTLALLDATKAVRATNSAAITITIPTNASVAIPVCSAIPVFQGDTGIVTIEGDTGVTLESPNGAATTAIGDYRVAFKRDTDTWVIS